MVKLPKVMNGERNRNSAEHEEQMRVYYSLYGRMLTRQALYKGYQRVKRAKGAAGIDGQSLSDFGAELDKHLQQLLWELQHKRYTPSPVRRVEIAKSGGGVRLLGIPTVRDRIVQQVMADILTPIFDPHFHPSSYGYRAGKSCHDAINKATLFIREYGRQHVVDMDLSKCFDRLDHELIISSVRKRVADGSILALLRAFLSSGVMVGGIKEETVMGSPQGGVISPLLANIYLDAFDQEMKARNHRIVRYADDILILCGSEKGAENALSTASEILEHQLKLTINREKTHIVHSDDGVKFLGVEIGSRHTRIQKSKLDGLKQKLKIQTVRSGGKPLRVVIEKVNPLLRGFSQYFKIADCSRDLKALAQWLRRRLRSIQLKLWKKATRLHRRLRQLGYKGRFRRIAMSKWASSLSPQAHYAMPIQWFNEQKLYNLAEVKTGCSAPGRG